MHLRWKAVKEIDFETFNIVLSFNFFSPPFSIYYYYFFEAKSSSWFRAGVESTLGTMQLESDLNSNKKRKQFIK